MRRSLVQSLKNIDKVVGTPLCFFLGIFDKLIITRNQPPTDFKRILVIKLVAIGDLVVALPTLKAIKKSYPQSHLTILVTPRVKEVVEGYPYLDEITYYDILGKDKGIKNLFKIIKQLRENKFDLVIDLEQYYRITSLISYLSGITNRAGFNLPGQGKKNLLTIKAPYSIEKHEVEAFLKLAKQIGANTSEIKLEEIWVSVEDQEYVDGFLTEAGVKSDDLIVGIHPGTGPSAISRRWQMEKFGILADWLIREFKAKVIFTGSKSEVDLINKIVKSMTSKPIVAAGKTSLKQLAEISRRCTLFISVDTGPLHIAAAMGTKVIGLYGPNTPVKWGPYGNGHITIYKGLECSPCTKQYLGQVSNCKDPICMKNITVEDVKSAVRQILSKTIYQHLTARS
jgi:heptosyltransferase II